MKSGAIFHTESSVNGTFRLDGLRIGRYSLSIHAIAHDALTIEEVIVEHGPATRVDVHLILTGTFPLSVGLAPMPLFPRDIAPQKGII